MRGTDQDHRPAIDIDQEEQTKKEAPTTGQEEDPAATECFGYNVLKIARYTNLIVGLALIAGGVMSLLNVFAMAFDLFLYPGALIMNIYLIFFGMMIVASSFSLKCVQNYFMFLMTGVGKGLFNIFVGACLFVSDVKEGDGGDIFEDPTVDKVMGICMFAAGGVFLFLSVVKKMSDEDLQKAVSAMAAKDTAAGKKAAQKGYEANKDDIHAGAKYVAVNNKDVVAKVAMDNKEVIAPVMAQAAADAYLRPASVNPQGQQQQQNYNDNQGYNNQGYNNQGQNNQGYNDQGHNNQGYNNQGYNDQGYNNDAINQSQDNYNNQTQQNYQNYN